MLALERRNRILEKLQEEKRVVVSELSQLYDVSEETIRRDLEKLEKDGLATKSYGGAVINENINIDMPFNVRKNRNVVGKQKIAEIVASMVQDGEHIFLDASTTAVFVAKAIKSRERMTVITNSIEIIIELSDVSDWNIISTGGSLKEGYLALVGPKTEAAISSYYVDKAIVSCKALDTEKGIMDSVELFSAATQAMLYSSRQRILAVDSSKFDKVSFVKSMRLKQGDILVTDRLPSEDWQNYLQERGVQLVTPEAQEQDQK